MPPRTTLQGLEENAAALRALVDARSPSVVRGAMEGRRIAGARQKYPTPSIGYRSGRLTVTGYLRGNRGGVNALIVRCDCGRPEYTVASNNFKTFKSMRCSACGHQESNRKHFWRYIDAMPDEQHRARLLNRLSAAITRCHSLKCRVFHHYGGRGISVCREWRTDRTAFLRYVQGLPGWDNPDFEMDRVDVDGNYEPGNIRFVSRSENARNKRKVADLEARIRELEAQLQSV